jgi:hypothetical protein
MSDPERPAANPRARPARWLDRLSLAFVVLGVAGVAGAAAPSLLRAAGRERTSVDPGSSVEPPHPSVAPTSPRSPNYAFDDHPRFAPDDDDPHVTELERLYPDGMWPGHRDPPRDDDRSGSSDAPSRPRTARARSALIVHEHANAAAPTTGLVPPGAKIMVLGEVEGWALVLYRRPEGVIVGWARRSGIAP